jgi:hypothetical protein
MIADQVLTGDIALGHPVPRGNCSRRGAGDAVTLEALPGAKGIVLSGD